MKLILKAVFLILFLHLFVNKSSGQQQILSIRQGLMISYMSDPKFIDTNESKYSYTAGISYEYGISKYFFIGIEANYENRGYVRYSLSYDTEMHAMAHVAPATSFDFRYFSFPVKITGKINLGKKYYGFLSGGIMPAYLILIREIPEASISSWYSTLPQTSNNSGFIDITDKAQRFDFGIFGDIGVGYKLKDRFFVDISFRKQQSLTSMDKNSFFPEGTHFNSAGIFAARIGANLK